MALKDWEKRKKKRLAKLKMVKEAKQQIIYDKIKNMGHDDETIDQFFDEEFKEKDSVKQQMKKFKRWIGD